MAASRPVGSLPRHAASRASGGSTADEVVLDLSASQDNEEHRAWLAELVAMYRGWAAHRGYEATPLA